ncbi:MAG TPA: PEP-CTERM sorting domain-containing protein [Terriglobales bacterium]|nr:PEP-CTERM sorting domain-containing protein [Terriglobales bacterium]
MTGNVPTFAPLPDGPGRAQHRRGFVPLLLGLAAVCGVLALSAGAQTPITLNESADVVAFSSNGNGVASVTLGNCNENECVMSGGAEGTFNGSTVTAFTITQIPQFRPLTNNGGGSFSENFANGPINSLELISNTAATGGANQVVFSGMFTALNFTDYANDQVAMSATIQGTGSYSGVTITIPAAIQLDGASIEDVANSHYPVVVSGSIVPEPATLVLFGTGLLCLGGIMRRRLGAVADGESA